MRSLSKWVLTRAGTKRLEFLVLRAGTHEFVSGRGFSAVRWESAGGVGAFQDVWKNGPAAPKGRVSPGARAGQGGVEVVEEADIPLLVGMHDEEMPVVFRGADHLYSRENLGLRVETGV